MKQIPVSGGRAFALVDDEDFDLLARHKWYLVGSSPSYAKRTVNAGGRSTTVYMHRVVAQAPDGVPVDHANGNSLDNRRANLRLCDQSQNNANGRMKRAKGSSSFRGVSRTKTGKWEARIMVRGKNVILGYHDTEEDAARAYDRGATEHFGEFATLNFPGGA